MKSQARATSHPPPSAKPLTAAMKGTREPSMSAPTRCPSSANRFAWGAVISLIAAISAPAANALSPAPVTIVTRTDGSSSTSEIAARSSRKSGSSRELSFSGRFRVRVATWASRSMSTVGMWTRVIWMAVPSQHPTCWFFLLVALTAGCAQNATERAQSLVRQHREEDAVATLRERLRVNGSDLVARKLLVRVLALTGDLGAARLEVKELAEHLPANDPSPAIELGHALELSHRYDE